MSFPDATLAAYWFALGACIGSFLNVVILRLPEGLSIVTPRSRCPTCLQLIRWYDNIPLVSFLLLRARCRRCGAPIRWRYFLVELLMACLALALWLRFGWAWDFAIWLLLFAALLAITYLDIDHWWVPDVITYPAALFAFAVSFIPGGLDPLDALFGLVPALLAFAVAWLFAKVTRKEGLGFGDVKLLAVLGLATGVGGGLAILVLAALQGTVVGLLVQLTGGHHPEAEETNEAKDAPAAAPSEAAPASGEADAPAEEEWVPPPRAFPFGPFLVLGTYQIVLLPEWFADLPVALAAGILRLVGG